MDDRANGVRPRKGFGALAIAAVGLAIAASEARTAEPEFPANRIFVRSYNLNAFERDLDGQWQGITFASDGNCYFASSTHSARHGGLFLKYDPRTGEVKPLCEDITRVCGEDPAKTPPQGKIHSPIVELDGWLYFATHLANYWEEAAAAYTGAHVVGYEMATGNFRDLGIVQPNYSIYSAIGLDAAGKKLYVFTVPFSKPVRERDGCHLWRVDLTSGAKTDLGLIQGASACPWFLVDRNGDCWFGPRGLSGTLLCARAATGKIDRYENVLPGDDPPAEGKRARRGSLDWVQALPDGDRCLVTMTHSRKLWIFDSTKQDDLTKAFLPVADIGSSDGITLGGDRVYYIGRPSTGRPDKGFDLHLYSVSIAPGAQVVDHGLIMDQDGRRPWRISSLATDGKGKVFMVGDWHLLTRVVRNGERVVRAPGEKGSMRHMRDDRYDELWRAQFFAVVEVR